MRYVPVVLACACLALVESARVAKTELPAQPADAPAEGTGTAWITVGDDALAVLQRVAPRAKVMESRQVPVNAVEGRTTLTRVRSSEGVHVVAVDESALDAFTFALHEQSKHCGGFMRHESLAEALAVVERLQSGSTRRALTTGAQIASAALTVPSYAIDNVAQVNALLPQLQATNLMSTIEQLALFVNRYYKSSWGAAASDWLLGQWQNLIPQNATGLRVYQVDHSSSGWQQKAVVFEFQGTTDAAEIVVLGAHLDSIAALCNLLPEGTQAPGADDDASGVAGLTEVIRVLVANNYRPRRTLRFIAYDAEEAGLLGSAIFAQNAQSAGDQVVGVFQLDMTAYQGDPTDLWIITDYTDATQNQFLVNLAATYLPELTVGYTYCGYACSDHAAWRNFGFVASFPFEASLRPVMHDNPYLHTANDTTAVFNYQATHSLKFTKLALAYAVELGSDGPGNGTPTPTPTIVATPTPTPIPPTPTATRTATPTPPPPTPTATPTRTPTPIAPTATPTPVPLAGSRFYTLTPCRVLDTRNAAGPLGGPAIDPSASRTFTLTGSCAIPPDAKSLSANVTVTGAAAAGEVVFYPATLSGPPSTSTISFRAGQTRANNAHLLLAADATGRVVVKNNSAGSLHLVLDVNGYYR